MSASVRQLKVGSDMGALSFREHVQKFGDDFMNIADHGGVRDFENRRVRSILMAMIFSAPLMPATN